MVRTWLLFFVIVVLSAGTVAARDFSTSDLTKVVVLGSGMPLPDPARHGPGVAIIVNGSSYIIDAGDGIYRARGASSPMYGGPFKALTPPNLQRVFLTHLHSDHTVGLPSLIRSPFVMARSEPIHIWGPPGTERLVKHIMIAYSEDLAERRYGAVQRASEGWQAIPHEFSASAEGAEIFRDENVKVEAFRTVHATWPHADAYRFTTADRVIVISGDLRPCPGIVNASRGADILLHEVIGLDDRDNQP
jgi:ribonuclease BN (tRNA processing enzyme)